MKKFLPIIIFLYTVYSIQYTGLAFAADPTLTTAPTAVPTQPAGPQTIEQAQVPPNTWVEDAEVTFVGKTVARASDFLSWSIKTYKWSDTPSVDGLSSFWATIRNIVYAFVALFVLITAFILIINRGRNLAILQFIPRFIFIILLVTFSFALLQFLYQITDIIQGFFLQKHLPNGQSTFITHNDLLRIGFDYNSFVGYRKSGVENDESAFISLLLIRITAITYYIMAGLLLLRKIILWFFIVVSPIFPFLLFYSPIRNTAKIWIGEFFRWLLYGPLFAIFFAGVVALWNTTNGIPLEFVFGNLQKGKDIVYPTSINILLGGPGERVSVVNSINLPHTFSLYVVSLIMLWVVMILPFLLLRIFLDYVNTLPIHDSSFFKQFIPARTPFLNKPPPSAEPSVSSVPPVVPPPIPPTPASTGMARSLPFENRIETIRSTTIPTINQQSLPILRMTNLSVPTIRDIARIETNTITRDTTTNREVTRVRETLEKISNPLMTNTPVERAQFTTVHQQLVSQKQQGNQVASTILQAANTISTVKSSAPLTTASAPSFPVVNRVQTVSVEDYEAVKKLWHENYQKLDTPIDQTGKPKDRRDWVKEDTNKVSQAINLLLSNDPKQVKAGMQMVGTILPFLLIGGFSQTEVIAYLKAKLEAGKTTLSEIDQKADEEDTKVEVQKKSEEAKKEMTAEAEIKPEVPQEKTTFE